jgi:transcriptional regulator with XRE-family HTH domain
VHAFPAQNYVQVANGLLLPLFSPAGFVHALVTDRLKATDRGMARGNFGERLKRERELREVTLEEVTQATRIGSRFLEALENEEWDKLPGGVFNRGFVRSIAHYLGLDEEAFLAEYDMAHAAHADQLNQKHLQKIEDRIPPTPVWIPVALVLGVLLSLAAIIFGGIYGWRKFVRHSSPKPAASIGTTRPGENRHFSVRDVFVVSATGSSGVLLELNGEAMPPAGTPGTSGTITLTRKDLRQATGGNSQP